MNTDPDGRFWGAVVGAVVGAYFGGVSANGGQMDPTMWNSNAATYVGIGLGALGGGFAGDYLEHGLGGGGWSGNSYFTSLTSKQGTYTSFGRLLNNNIGMVVDATGNIGWGANSATSFTIEGGAAPAASYSGIALASAGAGATAAVAAAASSPDLPFGNYRPDIDGYISFPEAMDWYQHTPWWWNDAQRALRADIGKMDELWKRKSFIKFLNGLKVGEKKPGFFNFFNDGLSDQSLVYGNLGFRRVGPNRFRISHDEYDFDIKEWSSDTWKRNLATIGAQGLHGFGHKFRINFFGNYHFGK